MSSWGPKLGIIVQARMESTRLPQKVVLPLINGYSILDIILCRLKDIAGTTQIILATGELERNKGLQEIAEKNSIGFFCGTENDVLKRFIDCANLYGFNKVIRICADNPFLDMGLLEELVSEYKESIFDYVGFGIGEMPAILSHFGFFAELVSLDAMVKAHSLTTFGPDIEHVTRYIYNNRDLFAVKLIEVPEEIKYNQDIRLTVDNESDFRNAFIILEELTNGGRDFKYSYKDVLAVISKLGPGFVKNMKSQIIENSKK
jgi:spore coat polysaccharide biosynthesis protein SpsF (cytidylyltransferase family)